MLHDLLPSNLGTDTKWKPLLPSVSPTDIHLCSTCPLLVHLVWLSLRCESVGLEVLTPFALQVLLYFLFFFSHLPYTFHFEVSFFLLSLPWGGYLTKTTSSESVCTCKGEAVAPFFAYIACFLAFKFTELDLTCPAPSSHDTNREERRIIKPRLFVIVYFDGSKRVCEGFRRLAACFCNLCGLPIQGLRIRVGK